MVAQPGCNNIEDVQKWLGPRLDALDSMTKEIRSALAFVSQAGGSAGEGEERESSSGSSNPTLSNASFPGIGSPAGNNGTSEPSSNHSSQPTLS